MPIFEYQCSNCSEVFEQLVLSRRDNHVECPRCGHSRARQLISRFAAQTSGRSGGDSGECFSRSAGFCEAGGGPMA
jgi:putative FmdB family regulatory protein